ncbi:MAG: hypothetical protein K6F23_10235 [Solobacterium sp.]|nr:hypothetical protein [Solobacterium sp.]
MARASKKENKAIYQVCLEELGLSKEKASELLESIPPERFVWIESDKFTTYLNEVIVIAEKYRVPHLCKF